MAEFEEFQNVEDQENGTVIITGNVMMIVPTGGEHVRQIDIRLPNMKDTSSFTANLYPVRGDSDWLSFFKKAPDWFVVSNALFHLETGYLGCKVTATNLVVGKKSKSRIACNYVIVGRLA